MNSPLRLPLSNIQLELLKLFSDNLPDSELFEVKKLLVEWRFKKLREAADKVWEEKNWTAEDMERLLNNHERTPYAAQNEFLAKQVKH